MTRPGAVVVGRVSGATLEVARYVIDGTGWSALPTAATSVPWRFGEALGGILERACGWTRPEEVFLAVETPPLAGGSTVETLPDAADLLANRRALVLAAKQRGRQLLREGAAAAYDTSLDRVVPVVEEAVEGSSGRLTVVGIFTPLADAEVLAAAVPPPDLPTACVVLLPAALCGLPSDQALGTLLLLVEEDQLTVVLSRDGLPSLVRSFPLGVRRFRDAVCATVACSPQQADELLRRADACALSPGVDRILARALRPLVPLYAAAWAVCAGSFPAERPRQARVIGLLPSLFARAVCRSAFVSRCLAGGGSARPFRVQTPLPTTGRPPSASGEVTSLHLLGAFATALLARAPVAAER